MEKILDSFGLDLRTRNKLRNIIIHLRKHGKTADDFIEYADTMDETRRAQIEEQEKRRKNTTPSVSCPECREPMVLRPVNTTPGDQTGDDSTKVYICMNQDCLHQIFE